MYERLGGFTATSGTLPPGDAGTRKTLGIMRALAEAGARDVEVREAAIDALREANARPHDTAAELRAVFEFVRDRVRFTRDIHSVETLQSPRYTLEMRAGDCDDRATLLAAMIRAVGIPAAIRFRVIAANPRAPRAFSHVYVVATVGGRDVPLDPTYSFAQAGWEYPRPLRIGEAAA